MNGTTATARNDRQPAAALTAFARCRELEWSSGEAPEWIQLLPIGPEIVGRDGRAWNMSDPESVVAMTELPMVLDWEHSTEIKAPAGEKAPAAGWITELNVVTEEGAGRVPGVWGRVEWTPAGADSVRNHEYRYVSPVFVFTKASTELDRLLNAALTNRPNLELTALNREHGATRNNPSQEEHTIMNEEQFKALCAALGLPADSSAEVVVNAAKSAHAARERASELRAELTAANARASELVPRKDLEAALNRAKSAEDSIASFKAEQHAERVEAALKAACTAGKVSPASLDYHRDNCSTAEKLASFEAWVETLPALCQDETFPEKRPEKPAATATKLTETERAFCRTQNLTEEDFLAMKQTVEEDD